MTFEEWAEKYLGPEVQGVTDWTLFRECWEAAIIAVLTPLLGAGEPDEHAIEP